MDCFVARAPRNEVDVLRRCGMQNGIASQLALVAMPGLTSPPEPLAETSLMTRIAVGGFLHETDSFAPTTSRSPSTAIG
jgi:hypothetical protein